MIRRLLNWAMRHRHYAVMWEVTTHEGFIGPCDDDCCVQVRRALRKEWAL